MLASVAIGWIMFALGVALIVLELAAQAKALFARPERGGLEVSVEDVKDTAEALAKLFEAFAKFSERMQRLLLGIALIIGGIYLLSNAPF